MMSTSTPVDTPGILDACPDGLVSFDSDRHIVLVNPAFTALTGIAAPPLIGASVDAFAAQLSRKFVISSDAAEAARATRALLVQLIDEARVGVEPGEALTLTATDGRVLELRIVPVATADCSRLLVFRDLTPESRARRRKNEFIAHAAHELRTPLTSIHGFTQLLKLDLYPENERREMLDAVIRQSTQMLSVIDELLDLSRVEAERDSQISLVEVPMGDWVARMVANFTPPPQCGKPRLSNLCGSCNVKIDFRKMQRAMLNILANAYKFSPDGGEVAVVCREQLRDGRGGVLIEVRDHGIGMSLADQERVWEPFQRGTNGRDIPGTGLGLSITKHIIEGFGGHIKLASRSGAGTTVSIWLPLVGGWRALP